MNHIQTQKKSSLDIQNNALLTESAYTYDQKFKQLVQNKKFLVPILKNVVKEYKDLPLSQIEDLIISVTGQEEVSAGIASEDVGKKDETVTCYDVLTACRLPESGSEIIADLYFDLEMQREQPHDQPPADQRGC